jgi:hypothetical protein
MQDCHDKSRVQQEVYSFHYKAGLKFKEETSKLLHLDITLYGAKTSTFRKVDEKHLESFEMWCLRGMEKFS